MSMLDKVPTARSTTTPPGKQWRMMVAITPNFTSVPRPPPKEAKIATQSLPQQSSTPTFTDTGPYVTLLVGKQDLRSRYLTPQLFHVPASAIQHAVNLSKYYAESQAAVRSNNIIRLPDLDPNAFELYCEYISTRSIAFPRRIGLEDWGLKRRPWICCWPLINAHIFATTVGDPRFGRYVLGLLIDKLALREAPDPDTITHVFTARDAGKDLKAFVVRQTLADGLTCFGSEQISRYPATFLHDVLHKISKLFRTRRREAKKANRMRASVSSHQPDYYSEGTLKLVRERVVHALMGRESHVARVDADANGISSIDWANPTEAEQNRTLPRAGAHTGSTSDPYLSLLKTSIENRAARSARTGTPSRAVPSVSAAALRTDAGTSKGRRALLPVREAHDSAPDLSSGVRNEMTVNQEQPNGPKFHRRKSSKRTLILELNRCSPIPEEYEGNEDYVCTDRPQDKGDGIQGPTTGIATASGEADTTSGLDSVVPGAYPESVASSP